MGDVEGGAYYCWTRSEFGCTLVSTGITVGVTLLSLHGSESPECPLSSYMISTDMTGSGKYLLLNSGDENPISLLTFLIPAWQMFGGHLLQPLGSISVSSPHNLCQHG